VCSSDLYLFVRDYRTVELTQSLNYATQTPGNVVRHIVRALTSSRTMLWACVGSAMQLIVVSALWAWLPSYLNRIHGVAPEMASKQAALVVLAGAAGAFFWGGVVDRFAIHRLRNRLFGVAIVCLASLGIFAAAFWGTVPAKSQLLLVIVGGFLMTCTVGVIAAVVIDVIHPGVRSTGAAVLSLFQNLFGLALGPIIAGALSDQWGLQTALAVMPLFSIPAAFFLFKAAGTYEGDVASLAQVRVDASQGAPAPAHAKPAAA
jgi:MFS family permease